MSDHRRPYFKFFPRDFISDEKVIPLSMEARGAYITLLCILWKSSDGRIEYDEKIIQKYLGVDDEKFAKIWSEMVPYPPTKNNMRQKDVMKMNLFAFDRRRNGKIRMYSKRLSEEMEKVRNISEKCKKAGRLGGLKRSERQANAKRTRNHTDTDTDTEVVFNTNVLNTTAGKPAAGSKKYQKKVGKYLDEIDNLNSEILSLPKATAQKFNPYQFVQAAANNNQHPQAIIDTLSAIKTRIGTIKAIWPYGESTLKTLSQKYNESDHIAEAQAFKASFKIPDALKGFVVGEGEK